MATSTRRTDALRRRERGPHRDGGHGGGLEAGGAEYRDGALPRLRQGERFFAYAREVTTTRGRRRQAEQVRVGQQVVVALDPESDRPQPHGRPRRRRRHHADRDTRSGVAVGERGAGGAGRVAAHRGDPGREHVAGRPLLLAEDQVYVDVVLSNDPDEGERTGGGVRDGDVVEVGGGAGESRKLVARPGPVIDRQPRVGESLRPLGPDQQGTGQDELDRAVDGDRHPVDQPVGLAGRPGVERRPVGGQVTGQRAARALRKLVDPRLLQRQLGPGPQAERGADGVGVRKQVHQVAGRGSRSGRRHPGRLLQLGADDVVGARRQQGQQRPDAEAGQRRRRSVARRRPSRGERVHGRDVGAHPLILVRAVGSGRG